MCKSSAPLYNPQMTSTQVHIKKEQKPLKTVKRHCCSVFSSNRKLPKIQQTDVTLSTMEAAVIVPALQKTFHLSSRVAMLFLI